MDTMDGTSHAVSDLACVGLYWLSCESLDSKTGTTDFRISAKALCNPTHRQFDRQIPSIYFVMRWGFGVLSCPAHFSQLFCYIYNGIPLGICIFGKPLERQSGTVGTSVHFTILLN